VTDQIFYIREILEKKWEYNGTVHQPFIHFNKAYDSIKREVLYNILSEFGIPRKLVGLIKMCLNETYSTVRSFIICTHPQILLRKSTQEECGQGMWHAWVRTEKCKRFWWVSPKERDHVENLGVDGWLGSEWILGRLSGGVGWIQFA
jgi:hypothetical protein